jgi:hypothetical protein
LYGAFDDTIAEAITAGDTLAAAGVSTEHVAYFYPWVYIPTSTSGVNRLIPPDAYAAAKRAVAHIQVGPQQPGAGLISSARFVNGVATDINKTNGDALDVAFVNAIRLINNSVRIYGARSLSSDTLNFRYITAQDVVNKVVVEANNSLEDLIFSVIDGRNTVFASVESKLFSVLEPLRTIGALFEAFGHKTQRQDLAATSGYLHGLGHGFGLAVHESPGMSLRGMRPDEKFQIGTIICNEPGLYYPDDPRGGWGVRIEDDYWCNFDGTFQRLTEFDRALVVPM